MKGDTIRNDSNLSLTAVEAILARGSVDLHYGKMMLRVESWALDDARASISGDTAEERRALMASVDRALRRALPKMESGRFSKKVADNFHADLLLWTALKESGM